MHLGLDCSVVSVRTVALRFITPREAAVNHLKVKATGPPQEKKTKQQAVSGCLCVSTMVVCRQ